MAFCSNCGASLDAKDKFCGECGTPVLVSTANDGNPAESVAESVSVQNPAKQAAPSKLTTPLEVPKKGKKLELMWDEPVRTGGVAKPEATPNITTQLVPDQLRPQSGESLPKNSEVRRDSHLPKLGEAPKLTSVLTPKADSQPMPQLEQKPFGAPAPFGAGNKAAESATKTTPGGALPVFGAGAAASAFLSGDSEASVSGPFSGSPAKVASPGAPVAPERVSLQKGTGSGEASREKELASQIRGSFVSQDNEVEGDAGEIECDTVDGELKSYLVFSIVTTMCCCTPAGIAALIFSILCKSRMKQGDLKGALEMSVWAKRLNYTGLILGVLVGLVSMVIGLLAEN